jgi:membrane protease YdiL (CAAX protease family)
MPDLRTFLLNFVALSIIGGLLVGFAKGAAFIRRTFGEPLEPRQPVPWNGISVLGIVLLSFVLQSTLPYAFGLRTADAHDESGTLLTVENARPVLLGAGLANLVAMAIGMLALRWAFGAGVQDFGFSTQRLRSDIRLGFMATLAVLLPVYVVQFVLTQFVKGRHPIEVLITEHPQPALLLLSAFTAVIVAPLSEEFFFRVLLQGWLERIWPPARTSIEAPAVEGASIAATDDAVADAAMSPVPPDAAPTTIRWAPIVISAAIFSLLHLGWPGDIRPDPIPLFVLSLMLGYIYQRTHRIWPSIVVHFCLNGLTMVALMLELLKGS